MSLSQLSSSYCDQITAVSIKNTAKTLYLFPKDTRASLFLWQCRLMSFNAITLDPSLRGVSKAICLNSERLLLLFFFNQKTYFFPLGTPILPMCCVKWDPLEAGCYDTALNVLVHKVITLVRSSSLTLGGHLRAPAPFLYC